MTLLAEILKWSDNDLVPWQRDVMRRLFVHGSVSQGDHDDFYAMLKTAHGIDDPNKRVPQPLATSHLPTGAVAGKEVRLMAMHDLKDVNRLAQNQVMRFEPKGITAVYGGTGAGKSGYSRVLKRACRARDAEETVHPDLTATAGSVRVPTAVFDIEVSGTPAQVTWKQTVPAPDILSGIAVFDSRCARSYLDDEKDVAFMPYGLLPVEALGSSVLPTLTRMLEAEIASVNVDTLPFQDLAGNTKVGQIIGPLSATSNVTTLAQLGTLSEAENARLSELTKTLAEADPIAKAKLLRQSSQRIDALAARITDKNRWISDTTIANVQAFDMETETAIKAESVAAEKLRSGDTLLPGTGEAIWKMLFDAAEKFSSGVAYAGTTFPKTDNSAQCVLCQQSLDTVSAQRLHRFHEYVQQDVAKVASAKVEQRKQRRQKLADASLTFGLDEALIGELETLDAKALEAVRIYETAVEVRQEWMLAKMDAHDWSVAPALSTDPLPILKELSTRVVEQAADLEKAADVKAKQALLSEQTELAAREKLYQRLKPVLDLVGRMKRKALLVNCRADLKTKAISDKAKEFASAQVTGALKTALDKEFVALGVSHIKTKLKERVAQVKMKHKLVLDLPVMIDLDRVLSEGEQRSIAIASFLAELTVAGHTGGIVFDDPVSSLDHERRKLVARRLIAESSKRQVIVFTHDTVFLGELRDLIEKHSVPHLIHHLEWKGNNPGNVAEGLPWAHKSYKDRLDYHDQMQAHLAKQWPAHPSEKDAEEITHQYSRLRATIERVVQDVVFNGVIRRYRDWIQVSKLKDAAGLTAAECAEIIRLNERCNDIVDAHDPASGKNAPTPSPQELRKDLDDLKAVIATIKARR